MTAIIILNWNGADDTLACLKSLADADGDFVVYVVDNGSADDSVSRIQSWIDEHGEVDVRLVALDRNYGFAMGNNKGLEIAARMSPDSYLLLNNDTEVLPDFLVRLQEFSARHPRYRVLTPKINYYYDKHKIWNCGGRLFFGFRKYFYAGCHDSAVKEREYIDISFVTGCALFFYPELLDEHGHLLTERFFFGEEDFEFSMRMHKRNVHMVCVLDSLIYHKVGASGNRMNRPGKLYLHYLNRFIDVRLHKSVLFYTFWKILNIPLCMRHFYMVNRSLALAWRMMRSLFVDAGKKDRVTREDFESLVIRNDYFKKR